MRSLNIALVSGLLFILMNGASLYAQNDMFTGFEKRRDSAVLELNKHQGQNIQRVDALIKVIRTSIFLKQQKQVMPYCNEALAISRELDYKKGLSECYLFLGNVCRGSKSDSCAHAYYDSVIQINHYVQDPAIEEMAAKAYRWKGRIYDEKENYYAALNCFFEALKYYEVKKGDNTLYTYNDIFIIYMRLSNYPEAKFYAEKSIALSENGFPNMYRVQSYLMLSEILVERRELSLASYYLDKIKPYMPDSVQVMLNFSYYQKRGEINYLTNQYDSAFTYYLQAAKYAELIGHTINRSAALYYLSASALKLKRLDLAKKYADENFVLTERIGLRGGKINALENLSDYYHEVGNQSLAYDYLMKAAKLKDSLLTETNVKQASTLAAIYESDKKQKEILQLRNEKQIQESAVKDKARLNRIFIATIVGLLFFGYLLYRDFRNNQKISGQQQEIQQQKISELQKDKQLLTVDAMLRGQEEERSRMAKDLHDGLGGMLSGAKLSFINLKEKLILPAEYLVNFERSINLLDNTIRELRKIAHNLMPEVLVKFGLEEALKDFCRSIQTSSGIQVVYQQFGQQRKLSSQAEINVYRMVQELVNNSLKHADAKQIIVQLTKSEQTTSITVEDDGKGFDIKTSDLRKSAGFSNIRYRVNYFNGTLDIVSSPGNGTSVNIELKA